MLTFISSLAVEGALVITVGVFLSAGNPQYSSQDVLAMVAGYLLYRRVCILLLSPFGGILADRIGFEAVFYYSLAFLIVGFVLLLAGWTTAGVITIFTFNSINACMAPGGAAKAGIDPIRAVALNASWRDIGAAVGTVIGGALLSGFLLWQTFAIITFILTVLLFVHFRKRIAN
jgi:predicted MFS family arabinose efflux permease